VTSIEEVIALDAKVRLFATQYLKNIGVIAKLDPSQENCAHNNNKV
jgi:hypothetical protein